MVALVEVTILGVIGYIILGVVVGGIAGFFISRSVFKKQLKKNPPINENMIRAMYRQMGRKPTEAQIRQIMKSFENQQ